MYLSPEDAQLFYRLMFALHFYVNQKLGIRKVKSLEAYLKLGYDDKLPVRDAVYEHPELIDTFLAENPAQLNADELALVRSWKQFIAGDFFIERYLKKYSIWIGEGSPAKVYGVLGITGGFEEIIHPSYLPIRVRSILLPFKGRIIYDGLMQPYNVIFGSGIKASLREEYMAAKQNGRIIEALEATMPAPPRKAAQPLRDWHAEVDELVNLADKLKGKSTPLQSEAFSLLRASARLAQAAVHTPEDLATIEDHQKKVQRALRKLETALYRAEM